MRSRGSATGVLLDTSFLLPSMGIDTGPSVRNALATLDSDGYEIWVSRLCLLEVTWVACRLMREGRFDEVAFQAGFDSVVKTGRYLMVSEVVEAYPEALRLWSLGHTDMIDNLLYVNSVRLGLRFLTADSKLRRFLVKNELPDTTVLPGELRARENPET